MWRAKATESDCDCVEACVVSALVVGVCVLRAYMTCLSASIATIREVMATQYVFQL